MAGFMLVSFLLKGQSELTDRLLSILSSLKDHRTRTFSTAIRPNIDIGADDIAGSTEKVFKVLPSCLIGQLKVNVEIREMYEDFRGSKLTLPT